ncbi:MAG: hypothetical protein JWP97_5026 [Labilithrix sp.]|nr:hypothetical protein [Labilithrix sp.]
MRALLSALAAGLCVAACSSSRGVPATTPRPPAVRPAQPRRALLHYDLEEAEGALHVTVDAEGPREVLQEWSLALQAGVMVGDVTCAPGTAGPPTVERGTDRLVVHLPAGAERVRLRYTVTPPYGQVDDPAQITVSAELLRFRGRAVMILPAQGGPWRVTLAARLERAAAPSVLSTLGPAGSLPEQVGAAELADAAFVVAPRASLITFKTMTAEDDFAVIEPSALDYRIAMGEVATAREAVANFFGRKELAPRHFVVTPLFAERPGVAILRGTGGMVLQLPVDAPWRNLDTLEVATAFVLEAMDPAPGSPDEAAVLAGVARYLARAVLLDVGLLTMAEAAGDLDATLATLYSDPSGLGLTRDEERAVGAARGDLLAAWLDAPADAASRGTLAETMTRWAAQGRSDPSARGLRGLLGAAGPRGAALHDELVTRGAVRSPARLGYGPCFERRPHEVALEDRGYELDGDHLRVAKLTARGAAATAGLRVGDEIISARRAAERGGKMVTVLRVRRADEVTELRLTPSVRKIVRPGWSADEARCKARAP